jgi:hypothetical protein
MFTRFLPNENQSHAVSRLKVSGVAAAAVLLNPNGYIEITLKALNN